MFTSTQGISSSDGKVKTCQEANCVGCQSNYLACTACNTAAGYYLKSTSCIQSPAFLPREGANLGSGTVVPCSDHNCLTCSQDHTKCTSCDTANGWYRSVSICRLASTLGNGEGLNLQAGTIETCSSTGCINCKATYTSCLSCNTAANYYLDQSECKTKSQFSKTQGVNLSDGTVRTCTDPHCINCLNNYQICTECDQANGYIVETSNSTCKMDRFPLKLKFSIARILTSGIDLSFSVTSLTVLDPNNRRDLYRRLQYNGKFTVNFMSRSNPGQMTSGDTTLTVEAGATSAVINIKFNTYLPDKEYDVYIKSESVLNVTYEGVDYKVFTAEGTFDYTNPIDKSQADALGSLDGPVGFFGSPGSTDTAAGASITLALLALDPTGPFFRFTKILQIVHLNFPTHLLGFCRSG